jgi:ATP/maltotriose-dependent transcriptional regulator MalT
MMQPKFLFYQALATAMDGMVGRALELLDTMERLLPRPEDGPGIVAGHALVYEVCAILRGNLPAAYATLGRMEQLARQANHLHFSIEALQLLALADLMAGQLERAEQLLRQGAQHGRRSSGQAARQIWYWLMRVLVARNDYLGPLLLGGGLVRLHRVDQGAGQPWVMVSHAATPCLAAKAASAS